MTHVEPPHEPQEPRGMGTGTKVLLILLAVFGVFFLICCGGVVYMGASLQQGFVEDPAEVRALTEELAGGIDVPPEFNPAGGMNIKIPFVDQRVKGALYEGGDNVGVLMLVSLQVLTDDPAQVQFEMENALSQQRPDNESIHVEEYEQREFVIRGQPAKFYLGRGTRRGGEQEYWQVIGAFEGAEGPTGMMLIVDAENYDEEQISQIIESIE